MAQTQRYLKRAQIFVIEETSQDTYLVQTAASAILAETATYTIDSTNYEPSTVRGDFLSQDEVPGLASASINFRVPCHGDGAGTAGVAPEFGSALLACGMQETVTASTSVAYSPISTFDGATDAGPPVVNNPGPSYSVTALVDGNSYRVKGAFGNCVFTGTVGEPLFLDFTFTGAYSAAAADGLETASYDVGVSPQFLGATFSHNFGGAVIPKGVSEFSIDLGNVVTTVADVNDAAGIYGARITNRSSVASLTFEMPLVGATNASYHALWRAGTTGTLTTGVIGSAASNRYALSVGRMTLRPPETSDRDGIEAVTLSGKISSAASDVEGTNADITLTFT